MMFTVTADIVRLVVGIVLFSLDFWLFETVGAIFILLACANFAIHAFAPEINARAKVKYAEATEPKVNPICSFDASGDMIANEVRKHLKTLN